MRMSKQHFKLIAEAIRDTNLDGLCGDPGLVRLMFARQFADRLSSQNEFFKRELFVDACVRRTERELGEEITVRGSARGRANLVEAIRAENRLILTGTDKEKP